MTFNITGPAILAAAKAAAELDVNGNRKIAGHSAQSTNAHIHRMAKALFARFDGDITYENAHRAARILHNEHGFRLSKLQRTWGELTGEIIRAAVKAAR